MNEADREKEENAEQETPQRNAFVLQTPRMRFTPSKSQPYDDFGYSLSLNPFADKTPTTEERDFLASLTAFSKVVEKHAKKLAKETKNRKEMERIVECMMQRLRLSRAQAMGQLDAFYEHSRSVVMAQKSLSLEQVDEKLEMGLRETGDDDDEKKIALTASFENEIVATILLEKQ